MSESLRQKARVVKPDQLDSLVGRVVTAISWVAPGNYEDVTIHFDDGRVLSVGFYSSEGDTYLYDTAEAERLANADWRKP